MFFLVYFNIAKVKIKKTNIKFYPVKTALNLQLTNFENQ